MQECKCVPCLYTRVPTKDVPGKEREKMGTGKKRERNAFFSFPFLHFWAPVFFPVSGQNHEKRVKNEAERPKNSRKDVEREERPFHAVPNCRIWRDSIFCPLKPVSDPVPTRFLPRFFPVLVPFLYCLAITSRCAPVAAQPLDHVGPSLVRRTSGRFVFMARRR